MYETYPFLYLFHAKQTILDLIDSEPLPIHLSKAFSVKESDMIVNIMKNPAEQIQALTFQLQTVNLSHTMTIDNMRAEHTNRVQILNLEIAQLRAQINHFELLVNCPICMSCQKTAQNTELKTVVIHDKTIEL